MNLGVNWIKPQKLKNLRDLQKIIPEVLSELKAKNDGLGRAPSPDLSKLV